jgi:undecaprenyl-diphosphatase
MNSFDRALLHWVNQFAHRSYYLDTFVGTAVGLDLLRGGIFMAVLFWIWCARGADRERHRQVIVATVIAAFASILAGRAIANGLPFRVRPIHNPAAGVVVPLYAPKELLRGWSSFPSDHAMLFATLATGLCFVSPLYGIVANIYALVFIDLPRVFIGWHYPTDIIAGIALGVVFGVVANLAPVRQRLARWPLRLAETRPGPFYALACVLTIQVGTMFNDVRTILHTSSTVAKIAWCKLRPHAGCVDPASAMDTLPEERHEPAPPPTR